MSRKCHFTSPQLSRREAHSLSRKQYWNDGRPDDLNTDWVDTTKGPSVPRGRVARLLCFPMNHHVSDPHWGLADLSKTRGLVLSISSKRGTDLVPSEASQSKALPWLIASPIYPLQPCVRSVVDMHANKLHYSWTQWGYLASWYKAICPHIPIGWPRKLHFWLGMDVSIWSGRLGPLLHWKNEHDQESVGAIMPWCLLA